MAEELLLTIKERRAIWKRMYDSYNKGWDEQYGVKEATRDLGEAQLAKAKPIIEKQERVQVFSRLTNQGNKVYGFDWAMSKKAKEWQLEMQTDPEIQRMIWEVISGQALRKAPK